ncbi:MAG: HEAT repeat domain-containing protein [Deltaproteobacteria bacterium]|nr:HEAT repeat domain-containing protein [Deltaproteobacteria bacterium]MCL5276735.1 HEAT repeat domain-containing protein [Deltaproteobacteria bacterium]
MTDHRKELAGLSEEERLNRAEGIYKLPFGENIDLFRSLLGDESFRVRKTALDVLLHAHQSDRLIDLFIEILDAQDNAGLRTAGVEGLTRSGARAIDRILKAIDPGQWELTKLLVDVLGDIGDQKVIPVLLELTGSPQQNLSTAAIEALGKLGTGDVVPHLGRLLRRKEVYIIFSTLEALASLGKKGFKLPLQDIIPLMSDPLLKKAVLDLFGSARDPLVVPYLIEGIKDTKRLNRESAAKSLLQLYSSVDESAKATIKDTIQGSGVYDSYLIDRMLSSIDPAVIKVGIRLLGWSGRKSSIPVLFKHAEDPDITDACVSALMDIGEPARDDVVGLLVGNKSTLQIRMGLQYLSMMQSRDCPPPEGLSYLLELEEGSDLLMLLAQVIGKYRNEQSLRLLTRLMLSDDKTVSGMAVDTFIQVGSHMPGSVISILHKMVKSPDHLSRLSAARLIPSFYRPEMDDIIKNLLNDSEAPVRAAIISAVGSLRLGPYLEYIQMALTDESREVRIEAIRASSGIVPERFIDIIKWLINDEDPWVRIEIIKRLKDVPQKKEAVGLIKEYVNDGSPAVMLTALQALLDVAIEDSKEEITRVLSVQDEDIVKEALYMLGRTNKQAAYRLLKEFSLSGDPKIRGNALSLLKKYNSQKEI